VVLFVWISASISLRDGTRLNAGRYVVRWSDRRSKSNLDITLSKYRDDE
jgi:hypothetical protein